MKRIETEEKGSSLGLSKTCSTSLIIAAVIDFLAMGYALYKGVTPFSWGAYLPWILSYGVPCLGMAAYGVVSLVEAKSHEKLVFATGVVGIVAGSLVLLSAFPIGIFLKNIEFMISLLVIGACLLAIGVLVIKAKKEE